MAVLAALAFTLAVRHVKLLSLQPAYHMPPIFKGIFLLQFLQQSSLEFSTFKPLKKSSNEWNLGEINQGYVADPTGQRRRSSVQPIGVQSVVMVPQPSVHLQQPPQQPVGVTSSDVHDRMSEYSHRTGRSVKHSAYRGPEFTSGHHFQL